MCLSNNVYDLFPANMNAKDKSAASWTDVQEWRSAIEFDTELCDFGTSEDLLALDAPEFAQVDFDPYAPEVNTYAAEAGTPETATTECSSPATTEPAIEVAPTVKPDPWDCESDTEDHPSNASNGESRLPKWKRRNAAKHLEGERHRRAKKKGNLLSLKPFLPNFKGKPTTNDLLIATIAKLREIRAKDAQRAGAVDFRAAVLSSRRMASVAIDTRNCVVEASDSFLEFIQCPASQPIQGLHISAIMHHHDAFQLEGAIAQDRAMTINQPIASQIVGLARFVRSGAECAFQPVEMDVSVSESKTLLSFALP